MTDEFEALTAEYKSALEHIDLRRQMLGGATHRAILAAQRVAYASGYEAGYAAGYLAGERLATEQEA